jgi:hypothetical protein
LPELIQKFSGSDDGRIRGCRHSDASIRKKPLRLIRTGFRRLQLLGGESPNSGRNAPHNTHREPDLSLRSLQDALRQNRLHLPVDERGLNRRPNQKNENSGERRPKREEAAVIAGAGMHRTLIGARARPGPHKTDNERDDRQPNQYKKQSR